MKQENTLSAIKQETAAYQFQISNLLLFRIPRYQAANHQHHHLPPNVLSPSSPFSSHPHSVPAPIPKSKLNQCVSFFLSFLSADSQTMPGGSCSLISPNPSRPLYPTFKECLKGWHWTLKKEKKSVWALNKAYIF